MLRNKNVGSGLTRFDIIPIFSRSYQEFWLICWFQPWRVAAIKESGDFCCRYCQHRLQGFLMAIHLERDGTMECESPLNKKELNKIQNVLYSKNNNKIFSEECFYWEFMNLPSCTCVSAMWPCILKANIKKKKQKKKKPTPCRMWRSSLFWMKSLPNSQEEHSGLSLITHWVWRHFGRVTMWFGLS